MSLLEAVELIRDELPKEVLEELLSLMPALPNHADAVTTKGFILARVNSSNFKRILEGRLKMSHGHSIERWLKEEVDFLNESFNNSTEGHVWNGYSSVDGVYISYLVDVGRRKWLKNIETNHKPPF